MRLLLSKILTTQVMFVLGKDLGQSVFFLSGKGSDDVLEYFRRRLEYRGLLLLLI